MAIILNLRLGAMSYFDKNLSRTDYFININFVRVFYVLVYLIISYGRLCSFKAEHQNSCCSLYTNYEYLIKTRAERLSFCSTKCM